MDFSPVKEISIFVEQEKPILKKEQQQIVSPSDIVETKVPVDSNLLSDKNTLVEKQSLKRGEIPEILTTKNFESSKEKPVQEKTNKTQNIKQKKQDVSKPEEPRKILDNKKNLDSILESTLYEIKKDSQKPSKTEDLNQAEQTTEKSLEARLNSMAGLAGNPDLIKGIPDGEVTLLNAKADRFAVFVRRVALQVFSNLRNSNWYEIGNLTNGLQTEEITVRATLDKNGRFENFEMLQSSKVEVFDRALSRSVRKGAWDKNPPTAALTPEGKIIFIFKAKAWVNGSPTGRSRQWVQLATGLE